MTAVTAETAAGADPLFAPAAARIRTVAGPYDRHDGPVTVATPSCCCCCCCCCLVTLTGGTAFTMTLAHRERVRSGGNTGAALGILAIPLAGAAGFTAMGVADPAVALVLVALVFTGSLAGGLQMAGLRWPRAIGLTLVTGATLAGMFVAEFFLALFTLVLIELAAPLGIFVGYRFAKALTPYEQPQTWPPHPGWSPPGGIGPGWSPTWPPVDESAPSPVGPTSAPWQPPEAAGPTEPTNPREPTGPTGPTGPTDSTDPPDPSAPSPWDRPER